MMERIKNPAFLSAAAGILAMAVMLGVLFAATVEADEVRTRGKLLGIMYHQVLNDPAYHNDYCVSVQELESDLKYLSENGYTSLLPSEAVTLIQSGRELPEKTVMLSFDDGYQTGYEYVLPLLEKYKLKAVFNIVGDYADKYTELPDNEKNLSFSYLTWAEIKKLDASPWAEIGNHTYSMHDNGSGRRGSMRRYGESAEDYRQALTADVQRLQLKLSQLIDSRPVGFAYPFGMFSEEEPQILTDAGFKVIMTCNEQPTELTALPLTVNRYNRAHGRDVREICEQYMSAL